MSNSSDTTSFFGKMKLRRYLSAVWEVAFLACLSIFSFSECQEISHIYHQSQSDATRLRKTLVQKQQEFDESSALAQEHYFELLQRYESTIHAKHDILKWKEIYRDLEINFRRQVSTLNEEKERNCALTMRI